MNGKPEWQKAAEIVRDVGGRVVGRTKLQKIAYLLELAGLGGGFNFEYHHYGPYSEDLANAIRAADAFDFVKEEEHQADWGGVYSVYEATNHAGSSDGGVRSIFAEKANQIGSIELELAATAAYLSAVEKCDEPWRETRRRKPEKATRARLEEAKKAYKELQKIKVPQPLPKIV